MRLYDLLADCVESRKALPQRIGGGPWQTGSGENVNRAVKAALRDGLMTGHFPSGRGFCDLTDKGRKIGEEVLEARRKADGGSDATNERA